MRKKIDSPFSTGLPAKIYWCIYIKSANGYEIAKMVFGKEKNPPTPKIYQNLTKMETLGFITRDEIGICYVKIDPLVSHLGKILEKQGVTLTESDRFYLSCIIDSFVFKKHFEFMCNPSSLPQIPHKSTNFIDAISGVLALSASYTLQFLEDNPDERDSLSGIYHDAKKTLPDEILAKINPFNKKNVYRGLVRILDYIAKDPKNQNLSKMVGQEIIDLLDNFEIEYKKYSAKFEKKMGIPLLPTNDAYLFSVWYYMGMITPEEVLEKMSHLSPISILAKFQRFFTKIGEIDQESQ